METNVICVGQSEASMEFLCFPPSLQTGSIQNLYDLPLTYLFLPPQIHVVHYNSKYSNYDIAKSAPDGLAVLAALVEVGRQPARAVTDWHPPER